MAEDGTSVREVNTDNPKKNSFKNNCYHRINDDLWMNGGMVKTSSYALSSDGYANPGPSYTALLKMIQTT